MSYAPASEKSAMSLCKRRDACREELERIGEGVAGGLQPEAAEFYQRRWKAKD